MIKKMPPPTLSVVNSNIFGKHRFACNCITYLLWSSSGVLDLNWIRSFNLRSRTIYVVNTNSRYCLRDIFLLIRKLYPKDFQKERERKKVKNPFYKGQFPKRVWIHSYRNFKFPSAIYVPCLHCNCYCYVST